MASGTERSGVNATAEQAAAVPVTQKREFWVLMGYAVVLGVFGAFAALIFVGAITFGGKWYSDSHPGWFGGHWWWVAVATAAGVAVGLVRRLTRLPWKTPGLFEDLQTEHVDAGLVPGSPVGAGVPQRSLPGCQLNTASTDGTAMVSTDSPGGTTLG